jgi:hypothetical protein
MYNYNKPFVGLYIYFDFYVYFLIYYSLRSKREKLLMNWIWEITQYSILEEFEFDY